MTRPQYFHGSGDPSLETWELACALSQEWAENARLAAIKRKRRNVVLAAMLGLVFIAVGILFILLVTGNLIGSNG